MFAIPKTATEKQAFVSRRKARARALTVTPWLMTPGHWTVRNETKGTTYDVVEYPTAIYCTCADYGNQLEAFGQGCCKHGYSVLNQLGFNSLSEYLEEKELRRRYQEWQEREDYRHLAAAAY